MTTLDDVVAKATELFGSEEYVRVWIRSPALALDGQMPADLIATKEGGRLVSDLLVRLEYCVYT